jgi:hypothetical protein
VNSYVDISEIKARLNIAGSGDDAQIAETGVLASRFIDAYANRYFYVVEEARYGTGRFSDRYAIPGFDLISLSALALDLDQDGTFESTVASTEYVLEPFGGPPYRLVTFRNLAVAGGLAKAIVKGYRLTGKWGYKEETKAISVTASGSHTASITTLTTSADGVVQPGMTLRWESEQVYVSARTAASTYTVSRGVNGTTAASHATGTAFSRLVAPDFVREAAKIEAIRLWKRKDQAYADRVVLAEGSLAPMQQVSPVTRQLLARCRRPAIAHAGGRY